MKRFACVQIVVIIVGLLSAVGTSTVVAQSSAPWTPPSNAPSASSGSLDPAKLPDIGGIHLGMPIEQAKAALQKLYPGQRIAPGMGGPSAALLAVGNMRVGNPGSSPDWTTMDVTLPPNAQVVWHILRNVPQPHVSREVLLAALRQKYGKETLATTGIQGIAATDDAVDSLWWVYDEQGHLQSSTKLLRGSPYGCAAGWGAGGGAADYMGVAAGRGPDGWCATSYVALNALIGHLSILNSVQLDMVDTPLLMRSAQATAAWARGLQDKAHQQQVQQSNQVKPQL